MGWEVQRGSPPFAVIIGCDPPQVIGSKLPFLWHLLSLSDSLGLVEVRTSRPLSSAAVVGGAVFPAVSTHHHALVLILLEISRAPRSGCGPQGELSAPLGTILQSVGQALVELASQGREDGPKTGLETGHTPNITPTILLAASRAGQKVKRNAAK